MMPKGYRVALRTVLLALTVAIIAALIWPSVRQTLAAIFGLLVGAATIAYALLTARMVHATDKMRVAQEKLTQTTAEALEVQTRPNVIISIELHSFLGYLVVQNAGVGEAF